MMVPLADSFNHDPNVKVTWSGKGTPELGALDLITRESLKSGNQLFTTYGPKSNEECELSLLFILLFVRTCDLTMPDFDNASSQYY
jgi:hypothetical protein